MARLDTVEFYKAQGKLITVARKQAGLSQEILAARLGISRVHLINMEHGRSQIYFHTIADIAQICIVPVAALCPDNYSPNELTALTTDNKKIQELESEVTRLKSKLTRIQHGVHWLTRLFENEEN